MQLKPITAIVVLLLLIVAALSVAGCTVTTNNQSSTQTQSPSGKTLTDSYASAGYDIVKPFTKSTNQYGNDVYTGVVKDNNSSHITPLEHNFTIEVTKSKNETLERGAQLRDLYVKQGYDFSNISGGCNYASNSNDPQGTHVGFQVMIGLGDPSSGACLVPYDFNQFTVVVDLQTRLA